MRDLIFLIIVVAISIISSVVKANKKAKERQRNIPTPNNHDTSESNPWDDLIMETELSESRQSPEPAYEYETASTSNVNTESAEIESVIRRRSEDVAKRYENKKTASPIFTDDIQSADIEHENVKDKALNDFNAIDAVIYSEILKPKF